MRNDIQGADIRVRLPDGIDARCLWHVRRRRGYPSGQTAEGDISLAESALAQIRQTIVLSESAQTESLTFDG